MRNVSTAGARHCSQALLLAALVLAACARPPYQVTAVQPGPAGSLQGVTAAAATDSVAEQYIRPYRQRVVREMSEVIGQSRAAMVKPGGHGNNAPLTRWMAGVLLTETGRITGTTPDFAALTNGSIRSGLPEGNVTVGNVFEIMPFENELTVLTVPGATIQQLFEYANKFDNLAAVNATWTRQPDGRATDIRVGGQPLDLERRYTLAINDYLANGGDGMTFLKALPRRDVNRTIRQTLLDYIRREKVVVANP